MNQVLSLGISGLLVEVVQVKLNVPRTGVFDKKLQDAVKEFQSNNGIKPDGIIGQMTWDKLDLSPAEIFADTDAMESATWIEQYNLPDGEFVAEETAKKWLVLHSNHGTYNPYKQIDTWAKDHRGRVGSHYVIGGSIKSLDDTEVDGRVLQAINDINWAYHLGAIENLDIQTDSISIELCNAGPLDKVDDKFYTWFGLEIAEDEVSILNKQFNGHKYFHKYTTKQLESLKALLLFLRDKHGIDLKQGIVSSILGNQTPELAFEYNLKNVKSRGGLYTHANLNKLKLDLAPQPELIEMLATLR